MRIHVRRLALAPVAHEPVELLQRGLVITAVALEGDGDVLTGVHVRERQAARVAFRGRVLQRNVRREQQQAGGPDAGAEARDRIGKSASTCGTYRRSEIQFRRPTRCDRQVRMADESRRTRCRVWLTSRSWLFSPRGRPA